MKTNQIRAIIQDNILIFSLCSGILVLFFALWMAPLLATRASLSAELPRAQALKKDIEQVKAINAVLDEKLAKLAPPVLDDGQTMTIAADNAEAILADLRQLAADSLMTTVGLTPELITGKDTTSQKIRLTGEFTGPLGACRQMLIALRGRKHITEIENVAMKAADNETISLRLVLMVAIL